jgi:hypothetical protein
VGSWDRTRTAGSHRSGSPIPFTLDPLDQAADVVDLHSRTESEIVWLHDEFLRADLTVEPSSQGERVGDKRARAMVFPLNVVELRVGLLHHDDVIAVRVAQHEH